MVQKTAHFLAAIVLIIATLGICLFSKDFAMITVKPFFILDFLYILWMLLVFISEQWSFNTFNSLRTLKTPILFFFWGIILVIFDISFHYKEITSVQRFLQHGILFVYPILWMTSGFWLYEKNERFAEILAAIVLLPFIFRLNYMIGPVTIIPFLIYLNKAWIEKSLKNWGICCGLACIAFFPYWKMWVGSMNRTLLIELFVSLVFIPLFLNFKKYKQWFVVSILGLLIFFISTEITLNIIKPLISPSSTHATSALWQSLQHGDDHPSEGGSKFQFRFRKHLWKVAINDWKKSPIWGIGFIPEVPSYITNYLDLDVRNNGNFSAYPDLAPIGNKPVSGPHCSYLTILTRMGIVGFLIFLWLAINWVQNTRILLKPEFAIDINFSSTHSIITHYIFFFIPIFGAISAAFNIGFEGPHACAILWLFAGIALACSKSPYKSVSKEMIRS